MSDPQANPTVIGAAHQAIIDHLNAEALSLEQSTAGAVQAGSIVAHLSPIGHAQTERVDAQASAIGRVQAQQATISRSVAGLIQAEQAHVEDGAIIGLLLAGRVDGNVRPILDLRGVLVLGLVIGLVLKLARPNAKKTP